MPADGDRVRYGAAVVAQLTPAEVRDALHAGAIAVDVREDDEWTAGRIDGALHVPLGALERRLDDLPAAVDLIFVCRSGARSDAAAAAVAAVRTQRCANLAGGMKAWAAAGQPMTGYVA